MSMKTPIRKRIVGFGAIVAASAMLLTGCMGNAVNVGGDGASGGSAVLAMPSEPSNVDPIMTRSLSAWNIYYAVFDGLTRLEGDGSISPGLAESWTSNDTQDVWEFTIRDGVTFHDGTALEISDIVYTYEKILATDTSTNKVAIAMVDSVEAEGDNVVRFTLKNPFAAWLSQVATIGIVPEKSYEEKGDQFAEDPIGTGPFKFESWNHGVDYTVERYDDYWGEPAQLDKVTFKFVGAADARTTGVESGTLDTALIPASQVPVVESSNSATVIDAVSNKVALLGVNTTAGALQNLKLRQALPIAINREQIITELLDGYGTQTGQPVAKGVTGYIEDYPVPTYDRGAAKKLIEESGYDGEQISFQYASSGGDPTDPLVAQAIASDLEAVGLNIKLVGAEQESQSLTIANHQVAGLYLNFWSPSSMDGDVVVSQLLAGGPEDYARSPVTAKLYLDQQAASGDERIAVYQKIWEWNTENVSNIPLWQIKNAFASSKSLKWTPPVDGIYRAYDYSQTNR